MAKTLSDAALQKLQDELLKGEDDITPGDIVQCIDWVQSPAPGGFHFTKRLNTGIVGAVAHGRVGEAVWVLAGVGEPFETLIPGVAVEPRSGRQLSSDYAYVLTDDDASWRKLSDLQVVK